MRTLAVVEAGERRLSAEVEALDAHLGRLVAAAAPDLVAVKGVGTDTAATLLVTAGDTPERLRSEGSCAHLRAVAPLPASSGKTVRHRLNRGGDRQANRALHLLAVRRMRWDPATTSDAARRTAEGLSTPQILRRLKRYLARQLDPLLARHPARRPSTLEAGGPRSGPPTAPHAGGRAPDAPPTRPGHDTAPPFARPRYRPLDIYTGIPSGSRTTRTQDRTCAAGIPRPATTSASGLCGAVRGHGRARVQAPGSRPA